MPHFYGFVNSYAQTRAFVTAFEKRRGILDGVAITGGEPLLQPDIGDFLARIREMGFQTKLDHNGSRPDVLRDLISRGLLLNDS